MGTYIALSIEFGDFELDIAFVIIQFLLYVFDFALFFKFEDLQSVLQLDCVSKALAPVQFELAFRLPCPAAVFAISLTFHS